MMTIGNLLNKTNEKIESFKTKLRPRERIIYCTVGDRKKGIKVIRKGVGIIKNDYGKFYAYYFHLNDKWKTYTALVKVNKVDAEFNPKFDQKDLLLRIDSACSSGQIFNDKTCECKDQLYAAMKKINENGEGIIIHIHNQDGRGRGTGFKLGTLLLEEKFGLDTVRAGVTLAEEEKLDLRNYYGVVAILKYFSFKEGRPISIMSNNPSKTRELIENGYVINYVPVTIKPTKMTRGHLMAKEKYLGHMNLVK